MAGHEDLASQDIASEVQIWRTPDSDSSDSIILPMLVWYGITIKMTLTYIFHSGFFERRAYGAVIDYAQSKVYIKIR